MTYLAFTEYDYTIIMLAFGCWCRLVLGIYDILYIFNY